MSNLLVDTSVLVDFLRQTDKSKTILVGLTKQESNLSIAIITHAELYAGKSVWEKSRAREGLELLFSGLHILPLEIEISKQAGQLRAKYGLDLFGALIASTALHHNLKLVTLNTKHFAKIPDLKMHLD